MPDSSPTVGELFKAKAATDEQALKRKSPARLVPAGLMMLSRLSGRRA